MTLDVPDSRPWPQVRGAQITNWSSHAPDGPPESHPATLLSEARTAVGVVPSTKARYGNPRVDRRVLETILRRIEQKGALCRHLLSRDRADVIAVVFSDSHTAGHRFRRYQQSPETAGGDPNLRDGIKTAYAAIDREIGRCLQALPEEPHVFVATNCGLADGYPTGRLLNAFCRQLGYQIDVQPRGVKARLRALADRIPEIWQDAGGEGRLGALPFGHGTNWSRTTAFAIPGYYTGYVRVNLKGREPLGIVAPGAEYDTLLQQLVDDFHRLVDEETGRPVVDRILQTASVFGGGLPDRLPDLVINWQHAHMGRRVVHPKAALMHRELVRSRGNFHSPAGLVMGAGPAIAPNDRPQDFSPLDLVPLFLTLLGKPATEHGHHGAAQAHAH